MFHIFRGYIWIHYDMVNYKLIYTKDNSFFFLKCITTGSAQNRVDSEMVSGIFPASSTWTLATSLNKLVTLLIWVYCKVKQTFWLFVATWMMNYMNSSSHALIISLLDSEERIISLLVPPEDREGLCRNVEL